jgi:hypothetical protein
MIIDVNFHRSSEMFSVDKYRNDGPSPLHYRNSSIDLLKFSCIGSTILDLIAKIVIFNNTLIFSKNVTTKDVVSMIYHLVQDNEISGDLPFSPKFGRVYARFKG